VAREVERRLARLRHGVEGPLLRDWAEAALPELVAAQEARVDGSTGTMLVEGEGAREVPANAENAWATDHATVDSATYALAPAPSGPTLAVEVDPTPPGEARPVARWPLAVALVLLAVATAAAIWLGSRTPPQAAPPPVVEVASAPPPTAPTTTTAPPPEASAAAPTTAPTAPEPASTAAPPPVTSPATAARAPAPARSSPERSSAPQETQTLSSSGRWEGSLNGRPMDLVLSGGSSLSGQVIVSFGANSVSSRVRGTYTASTRTLRLEDVEQTDDSGTYTATLSEDGSRMTGSFHASAGGTVVAFTATRSGR
jgi:hypothetical protein